MDLSRLCELGAQSLSWSQCRVGKKLFEAYEERGRIATVLGQFEEALGFLCLAEKSDPESFDSTAFVDRAAVALKASAFEAAIADCSKVLEIGDDATARIIRAKAHFNLEHYDLARADCSRILSSDASNVTARFIRGRCAVAIGAIQSALVDLDRCLEIEPGSGELLAARAEARLEAECFADAALDAQAALEISGEDGSVLYTLGCARFRLGETDEAKRALSSAVDLGNVRAAEKLRQWYGGER
jgi:tetratricopeptide (TPR) repeat protein